jgi:hypothetical protein
MKSFLRYLSLLCAAVNVSCGGGGDIPTPPPSQIAISIAPTAANLLVRSNTAFTATVTGSSNTAVTFSIMEGNTGGQITATGSYVAPVIPGTYHVRVTSVADSSKTAEAVVTVNDYANAIRATPFPASSYDYHTASLLADGSVLVAGGRGQSGLHVQTERYLPNEDRFVPGPPLNTAREAHSATVLPDGKVLVAGGASLAETFNSSEIYDPATAQFTIGPSMNFPHRFHVATLLKDGRVLVTGGIQLIGSGFGATPNTDIYEPSTGRFQLGERMNNGRWLHTATLLNDGRVLIVGGRENNCNNNCRIYALSTAEIFDPATGLYTLTGSLHLSRYSHSASLLPDGRVLILGGQTFEDIGNTDVIATGEIYDPGTGQFTPFGSMTGPRGGHTVTQLNNGKYLIAGGYNVNGAPSLTTEIFDPGTGTSTPGPQMNDYRIRHTTTLLLNGEVLIVGGNNSGGPVLAVDRFR